MKVTKLPFDPGPAAWNSILPPAAGHPELSGSLTVDVLIVGGGFAGISAARRLKQLDPTLTISLVDARQIAEGPAGRNSGFMIDLPHNLNSTSYAGDCKKDKSQTAMNREAIEFATSASEDYEMKVEALVRSGKINASATAKGNSHNQDYSKYLKSLDEPFELLDAKQMREISGSTYYETGLFTPGTAMLQPALYMRQFAEGLVRDGIQVFENSPITDLKREANSWLATTPKGQISAKKVILATNGHVESFGYFKRRLIHVYLYASMTRALTDREQKKLGGAPSWGFTPSDPMGTTVRKISGMGGTRIVIRNSISWAPERTTSERKPLDYASIHDRSFKNRFERISEVDMEYRWGGLLCLSRNSVAAFGEVDTNLFSACCQNGLGTAMGTLSGMATAEKLIGEQTQRVAFFEAQDEPEKLPPEPFANIGANVIFKWKEVKAGREL